MYVWYVCFKKKIGASKSTRSEKKYVYSIPSSFDWCPLKRDRFLHKYPPVMRMCQSSPQKSNHEDLYSAHRSDFGCNLRPEEGQGR